MSPDSTRIYVTTYGTAGPHGQLWDGGHTERRPMTPSLPRRACDSWDREQCTYQPLIQLLPQYIVTKVFAR